MNDVDNLTARNRLMIKPKLDTREERLARRREQQRRERKEKLYSYSSKTH
jgi:hypothetical protein